MKPVQDRFRVTADLLTFLSPFCAVARFVRQLEGWIAARLEDKLLDAFMGAISKFVRGFIRFLKRAFRFVKSVLGPSRPQARYLRSMSHKATA